MTGVHTVPVVLKIRPTHTFGRPLEVTLPGHRGWLARLANLAPGWAGAIQPLLERAGRARQRAVRG